MHRCHSPQFPVSALDGITALIKAQISSALSHSCRSQHQCWSGWAHIVPGLWGWGVCHCITPLNFRPAVSVVVCWCSPPPSPSPTPLPLTGGSKNAPLAAEELKTPPEYPISPSTFSVGHIAYLRLVSPPLSKSPWDSPSPPHRLKTPSPLYIALRLPIYPKTPPHPGGGGAPTPFTPCPPRLPSPTSPWDSPPLPRPPSGDSPSLHCFKPPSTSPQDSPSCP